MDDGDGGDFGGFGGDSSPDSGSGLFAITNPDGSTTYYDQNGNYVSGTMPGTPGTGGGDNPGATQGGLDATGGNNPLGGGSPGTPDSSAISSLLRALGISSPGGASNMSGLMSLLGPAISAALGYTATGKATNQMVQGIKDASAQAQSQIGGAQGQLTPFITAGQNAATKLGGMNWTPLAPQYKPLGAGRSLASFVGK
jgi:hypothetical protein